MPNKTPANVLSFDPMNRRSSRRASVATRVYEEAEAAALTAEAAALRVSPATLKADDDLYYLGPELRQVEAAYQSSVKAGRAALIAKIQAFYESGYQAGEQDAGLVSIAQFGRR